MKKIVSLILALALALGCASAFAAPTATDVSYNTTLCRALFTDETIENVLGNGDSSEAARAIMTVCLLVDFGVAAPDPFGADFDVFGCFSNTAYIGKTSEGKIGVVAYNADSILAIEFVPGAEADKAVISVTARDGADDDKIKNAANSSLTSVYEITSANMMVVLQVLSDQLSK